MNKYVFGACVVASIMAVPAQAGGVAFKFDQSTSAIAIGKIRMAAAAGEKIPLGWAVDAKGRPAADCTALSIQLGAAGAFPPLTT